MRTALDAHGLDTADIDVLIAHQANLRINEMVGQKLGLVHLGQRGHPLVIARSV